MLNSIGRDISAEIGPKSKERLFKGAYATAGSGKKVTSAINTVWPGETKVVNSIHEALIKSEIKDGMTISFHHHLRNGDYVLNMVLEEIARMGIKDIRVAASALYSCHQPLVDHINNGVVTGLEVNYMVGPVAKEISNGILDKPVIMRSHGGRDRAIEAGELKIDIAFIAAPSADDYGNINGCEGPSACGSLGYAFSDAKYASQVVVITDNLLSYPLERISIDQTHVDLVLAIDCIGDPKGIVSGTTRITRDPIGLNIAEQAARIIEVSGYLKDGFSFQTGAGGISLAVASFVKKAMQKNNITGSFGLGGITEFFVDMLRDGLFKALFDTQCFDLASIESLRNDKGHLEISSSMYSNPHTKGPVVNNLDVMILGATEIDLDFNVNVTTGSDGVIMGGSGGHCDTAAGSKLAIVVTKLYKARMPVVVEKVTTVNTPGETIDVLVTEYGIAVNPKRQDLKQRLLENGLLVKDIAELKTIADEICGVPEALTFDEKIVAIVEYRDGTIIDVIRKISD